MKIDRIEFENAMDAENPFEQELLKRWKDVSNIDLEPPPTPRPPSSRLRFSWWKDFSNLKAFETMMSDIFIFIPRMEEESFITDILSNHNLNIEDEEWHDDEIARSDITYLRSTNKYKHIIISLKKDEWRIERNIFILDEENILMVSSEIFMMGSGNIIKIMSKDR